MLSRKAEMGPSLPYGALKSTEGFYAHYYHDPALTTNGLNAIQQMLDDAEFEIVTSTVTPAECSCTRLTELLDDLGLSWNDGSTAIANALEAIWDTLYSDIAIQAWANDCNPSNLPGITLAELQYHDFPEKLLCQGLPQTTPDYTTDPMVAYTDSCNNRAKAQAALASLMINDRLLSSATKLYGASYLKHCLDSAAESFTCAYTRKEYHYTLYYYDQAGNLIKTVPPAGVNRLGQTDLNSSMAHRADTSLPFVNAAHGLVTNYKYNSLNQVRQQSTPDGGVTRFWYDALGRLIVSQNAKQIESDQYSYTLYDPLGRIIEVGQLEATEDPGEFLGFDEFKTWLSGAANHSQITHTVYDVATISNIPGQVNGSQQNLRNRISCVLYQPTRVQTTSFFLPDLSAYDYASYYSYDVHGNVKTVVHHDQYFENIFTSVELTNKIDYLYDLVSGSVKEVIYQQTKKDEFRHRYHYDADNRITRVYTSRNGMIWQLDAKYFYYPHGPLARVEVGQEQVQAFDYAYTLHGWLKGVNTNTLVEGTDIGKDGQGNTDNPNRWFGRDAAGFSLGYYSGDYQAIGQNGGDFLNADLQNVYSSGSDLFNGNISHMVTAIHQQNNPPAFTPVPQATTYRYDRLNRIKEMKAYQGTVTSGVWTAQNTQTFASAYKYDFNGNITELERYAGGTQIDDLEYFYNHDNHTAKTGLASNKLYLVDEQATNVGGNDLKQGTLIGTGFDPNDDATWNYNYDPIGNLIQDVNDSIDLISWTVTGKVSDVIFASSKDDLTFRYDPMGNRIAKIQKPKNWTDEEEWTVTWYSRDAQGNVMAVYTKPQNSTTFAASEFNIYGSSRIGLLTQPEELTENSPDPVAFSQTLGNKVYEFSNHLGNVLTTFSDRKIPTEGDPGLVAYYTSEILSSTDYYPFGFQMPGRVYEGDGYRYGFNSMEKDDELKGSGNSYDFGARIYDPRVGRWLAVDPLAGKYPLIAPYVFCANNPMFFIDPDGEDLIGWLVALVGKWTCCFNVLDANEVFKGILKKFDFGGVYDQKNINLKFEQSEGGSVPLSKDFPGGTGVKVRLSDGSTAPLESYQPTPGVTVVGTNIIVSVLDPMKIDPGNWVVAMTHEVTTHVQEIAEIISKHTDLNSGIINITELQKEYQTYCASNTGDTYRNSTAHQIIAKNEKTSDWHKVIQEACNALVGVLHWENECVPIRTIDKGKQMVRMVRFTTAIAHSANGSVDHYRNDSTTNTPNSFSPPPFKKKPCPQIQAPTETPSKDNSGQ